jgi:23S rRNA (guanosine2251-2'-O)-methyltransferase
MAKPGRPGARKNKKGPTVGTGGHSRKALEGKGPTPKATDRSWHVAGKRKAAQERLDAARAKHGKGGSTEGKPAPQRRAPKKEGEAEVVTGRNSVVEALRAKIPATTLYIASRLEMDDRVKEAISLAGKRHIPVLEVMRQEIDRMSGPDSVHQGIALKVPAYEYAHPLELLDAIEKRGQVPLLVALDGITDPRNLGAIVRSIAAFGGQGAIVPQRRSVGMTASAWKTSAGAASRIPVAMAGNLTTTL